MIIVKTTEKDALRRASELVTTGGILAFPTETFYGLGVRYDDENSLERICRLKKRPEGKALPLLIGRNEMLWTVAAEVTETAEILMRKFWPGPLTLLLQAREGLSELITAGTGKVAVRLPGKCFGLDLAANVDLPLTATSANISGMPASTTPEEVVQYFNGNIDLLLDGGKTPGGKPSTIADVTGDRAVIVREGVIAAEEVLRAL